MTNDVRTRICKMLCTNRFLTADRKLMPKVFVVNDRPYWFLNAAKRAAFGTKHSIEVIGIEAAFEWYTGLDRTALKRSDVEWHIDQTGSTFDGRLFDSLDSVLANSVRVTVIREE